MKINFLIKLVQSFKDITIRKKLLLSYFTLIFLPLGLLTFVSYVNVSRVYENQIHYSANQSFDQAYTFLSYKLNTLIKTSDVIYFNSDVQTILSNKKDIYGNDIIQQNIDMLKLDKFLNGFNNTEDIYRASLYVPGWLTFSNQDINFSNIDIFSATSTYKKLMLSKDKVFWLPPETIKNDVASIDPKPVISLLRKIRNGNQITEFIGIIKLSILESNIHNIIAKANITQDGVVYLQNSEGIIISCSNSENLKQLDLNYNIRKKVEGKSMSWETLTINKNRFAVTTRAVSNTDWIMVTAIPYSEILSQSNKIKNLMFVLMLVIGIIAYGLAYFISTLTVNRIILLMKKMKEVQEGELNVSVDSHSKDEIGRLMESFNYMVKRIRLLVEEQYQSGQEIKSAELKALQAQINPHFLYNTLDLINWKAIENDIPEIVLITQSLAKFYKSSLNKGRDIVTIQDEINHISNYVQIQNLRFDNRINLVLDIDKEIYQYRILKIILQPIVENSIFHGILENRNNLNGMITVASKFEGETIVLTVQDNGVGMTEEKASAILMSEERDDVQGYGIRNIDRRLKLCYGQQYGLTFHCAPGCGTLVEIRIPPIKPN
ncbi:MAG TPA: sensor histidine kinase [Ruminiclostridium sp.]